MSMTQIPPGFFLAANLQEIWWDDRAFADLPGRGRLFIALLRVPGGGGAAKKTGCPKQKTHLPGESLAVGAWATALKASYILQAPEDTHAPFVQHVQTEARFWEKKFI